MVFRQLYLNIHIKNDFIEEKTRIFLIYGWYISGQMKMKKISEVIELIRSEKTVKAESILINLFRKNLTKIEKQLFTKH